MIKVWMSVIGGACLVATVLNVGLIRTAAAQGNAYAYPTAGQSQEQQARDHGECFYWATQQTGVDPTTMPPPGTPSDTASGGFLNFGDGGFFRGGGVLGDAATGAGLGAIGGAIAGDAGIGAGIGALAGALFGQIGRSSNRQQRLHQRHSQYREEQLDRHRQAYSACMSARNYGVR